MALGCLSLGYQVALGGLRGLRPLFLSPALCYLLSLCDGFALPFKVGSSRFEVRSTVLIISVPNPASLPRLPRGGPAIPWTNPGHALDMPWYHRRPSNLHFRSATLIQSPPPAVLHPARLALPSPPDSLLKVGCLLRLTGPAGCAPSRFTRCVYPIVPG